MKLFTQALTGTISIRRIVSQTSFNQLTLATNLEVQCSGNPIEFGAQQCLLTNRSLNHIGD